MRISRSILCMICASFMLVGCSYFDTGETIDVSENPPPARIDLMKLQRPRHDPYAESIVQKAANGSVEVYSLDDDSTVWTSLAPEKLPSSDSRPRVYSSEQGVEIFALDGGREPAPVPLLDNFSASAPAFPQAVAPEPVTSAPLVADDDFVDLTGSAPGNAVVKVYFDHDSTELDSADLAVISMVGQGFESPDLLSVEGHASTHAPAHPDPVTRRIANLKVSMDRALSVARSLLQHGIPADAIRTIAWGDTQPPAPEGGKTPEEAARRVEIITQ